MKPSYRLFVRGKYFYCEDIKTGHQESLQTSDTHEASRLLAARNEATNSHEVRLAIGRAYLTAVDPVLKTRTWADVFTLLEERGKQSTQERACRAYASNKFDALRSKRIMETTAGDLLDIISGGKTSTNHYLKLAHGMALDLGWLIKPVLTRKCWPKIKSQQKRAITWDEHSRIIASERNEERRRYYDLLWETGASQTDAANLCSLNVDWSSGILVYQRQKTGQTANLAIGTRLKKMLKQLPATGKFFPALSKWDCTRRSIEFYRRCKIAKVAGVSLHSYRYAWAERAFSVGYPERFAQAALGHESRAVHHAYARKAKVNCPALDGYESKGIRRSSIARKKSLLHPRMKRSD